MLHPINLQLKNKDVLDLERLVISRLPKSRNVCKSDSTSLRPDTDYCPLNKSAQKVSKVPPLSNLDRFPSPRIHLSPLKGSLDLNAPQNMTERAGNPTSLHKHFTFSSSHIDHTKVEPKSIFSGTPSKTVRAIEKLDKNLNIASPRLEQIKSYRFETPKKNNIYSLKVGTSLDTDCTIASPNTKDSGMTEFFKENQKKYPTKAQFFSLAQKAKEFNYEDNLDLIKTQAKQSVFKRAKMGLPARIEAKQNSRESGLWANNKLEISKEDETKLSILRKKMETFTKFSAINNLEDKKKLYRELTLEYHPDKSKHEKAYCEEIFSFLRNNKKAFLVNQ